MTSKLTPETKLIIESGILVSLISGAAWLGVIAYKVDAQADVLAKVKDEQGILSKDLVQTQKQMIERLTVIETELKYFNREKENGSRK